MNIFKNLNVKKNPVTTVLGILNTLLFGAVILGLFDQATADHILLIVSNFADVLGTSPTLVVVGTALQAAGSIILLFAKDPQEPSAGSGGNVIRAIAILLLPGLLLVSCDKVEVIEPLDDFTALSTKMADADYQAMVDAKADALLSAPNSAETNDPIPLKDMSARVSLYAPALNNSFSTASIVVDTGIVELASFSCKMVASGGVKFTGIILDNVGAFLNWGNYFTAYRISPDSTVLAFAGFTTAPQTIAHNPVVATRRHLFWVVTQGSGTINWDTSDPDNIAISSDGYINYPYIIHNSNS